MANAPRDENQVPAILVTHGTTAVPASGDATGKLNVSVASYGTPVATGTNKTVKVTNSATLVQAANANRRGLLVVNNGATDCYVGFAATMVEGSSTAATGGALVSSKGSLTFNMSDGYTGPVYGITAAGDTILAALEW